MQKVYVIFVEYHGQMIMNAKIKTRLDNYKNYKDLKGKNVANAHNVANAVWLIVRMPALVAEIVVAVLLWDANSRIFVVKHYFITKIQV